jgi:PPK2 family polyphosphate:nucleotide phosphotransferase
MPKKKTKKSTRSEARIGDLLRVPPGPVDLATLDTRATPAFDGGKSAGKQALPLLGPELSDLQERLYANGRVGGRERVLLVLQGMDTSGKGGAVRHGIGMLDPQGVALTAFKAPSAEEKRRGFLWRIKQRVPGPGMVGIFDRSHYEDVLVARVRGLSAPSTVEKRYDSINAFEADLMDTSTTVIKCFLHISAEEQKSRLQARLDDPAKQWKFDPGDVDERARWGAYQEAYEIALERCNTAAAPWYVVPSDRKWYRNWAVTMLLLEHLRALRLGWPRPDFDVKEQRERLLGQP